ncbi:hypothetical protein BZK31_01715 [Pseudomonas floridensis]|uniref:Exo-alpha-sialidase n=1 Tax=Pseudomonas floridensis TaxID=1958950 RepID=A0A1X0NBX6_9PSED|nr:hypothetical protein [Pseudomonas floridensis]ORC61889.1 hypothetical protein BZK31_01715 [Pseudomonas floridensis]
MKLNSAANIHGILSEFNTITDDAVSGCRTALHNDSLFCAYLGEGRRVMYVMKPQFAPWGTPLQLKHFSGSTTETPEEEPATNEVHDAPEIIGNKTNVPSLVSFNKKLWLVYTDDSASTVIRAWSDSHAAFLPVHRLNLNIEQSATFAQLNDVLYMFFKLHDSPNIWYIQTTDMKEWTKPALLKKNESDTISTYLSPVAITYQGLIHIIYKDKNGGFFLLKSDGEAWTSPIAFIGADFAHSPGITIHNGLLKLVFCNLSSTSSSELHQYGYDGNALSPVVLSRGLSASGSPSLDTQDGLLIATYLESTLPA